jgi:hypothetical protein
LLGVIEAVMTSVKVRNAECRVALEKKSRNAELASITRIASRIEDAVLVMKVRVFVLNGLAVAIDAFSGVRVEDGRRRGWQL